MRIRLSGNWPGAYLLALYSSLVLWTNGQVVPREQINGGVSNETNRLSRIEERAKSNYRKFAIQNLGDASHGRELFFDDPNVLCSKCHTTDGQGGKAGPDLFAIGDKFGRKDLIESILSPSATIAVGYSSTIIETNSGGEHVGIVKQVADAWIELMGVEGVPVRISKTDIEMQRISDVSLMPDGLHAAMTVRDFSDIIEFLGSLRVAETVSSTHLGMPETIQSIENPVTLRPFHSEELKFEDPVWFGHLPGIRNAFLVLEHQLGRIWLLEKNSNGDRKTLFLDLGAKIIEGGTRGLLGLAFHPRFPENRKYYLALHMVEDGQPLTLTVERFAASDNRRDSGEPARVILRIEAATNVHYGGGLVFGPDGYLYIGMGDTGPQEDPQGNGQNSNLLRGKLMRLDVDNRDEGRAFRIPPDNPFVTDPDVRPEIWAVGFREPWRFSFDPVTDDLWVGDVGQNLFEEVDIVRRGENHGWNVYEGFIAFSNDYRSPNATYVPPVFAYTRKYGPSVTGGFVYRADPDSSFYGVYIFGDYETRHIWGMTQEKRVLKKIRKIGTSPQRIVSFGIDAEGTLYVVGYEGMIYRMDLSKSVFN